MCATDKVEVESMEEGLSPGCGLIFTGHFKLEKTVLSAIDSFVFHQIVA